MKRFLVTAGPTREYLDTVRFVSNGATGRTGFLLAAEAVRRGHEAILVSGPTVLPDPAGVRVLRVVSADDMARAVFDHLERTDVLVGTAAVCDWRPAVRSSHKLSKQSGAPAFEWVRTPDIMALAGERKGKRLHLGFALEDDRARERAAEKLRAKNLDYIVLNSPENLGTEDGAYELLARNGRSLPLGRRSKQELAAFLVDLALTGQWPL